MKNLVKRAIRSVGYELRQYKPVSSDSAQILTILKFHGVNLVFDVGANTGGFGRYLRGIGYAGSIVSFEPMKAVYEVLVAATKNDRTWQAAPRSAIGAEDGEVEMHISANSESSSILDMLEAHSAAAPKSAYIGVEKVPLRKLDTLAPEFLKDDSVLFVKIDTQGYEEQVLLGGANTISRAAVLQLELSLVDCYAGQKLMPEMVVHLKSLGFDLWGMVPVFSDPRNGRMMQMDGIFCKSASLT